MAATTVTTDRPAAEPVDRCPISRALGVVGTRSTLLIMREAFRGTTRFDDFAERVGITESVAAARLHDMVDAGLLDRRPYREPGQRTRYEYVMTDAGRDLLPVLLSLGQWGTKYLPVRSMAHVHFSHDECGATVEAVARCAEGHDVGATDLVVEMRR